MIALLIPLASLGRTAEHDWRAGVFVQLYLSLGVLAVVVGWCKIVERRSAASLGAPAFAPGGAQARWAGFGVIWAAGLVVLLFLLDPEPARRPSDLGSPEISPAAALGGLLVIGPVALAGAAAEEVLFRGWGLSVLSPRIGTGGALAVTSLLFGAAHVPPSEWLHPAYLLSVLGYSIMGAGLGALALRQGHVYGATAFHAGYNFLLAGLAFAATGFDAETAWSDFAGSDRGISAVTPAAAFFLLQAAVGLTLIRRWLDER